MTVFSVVLYLMAISFASHFVSNSYMMRAAYLAIAGYVVGFFADQRAKFEARVARTGERRRTSGHSS